MLVVTVVAAIVAAVALIVLPARSVEVMGAVMDARTGAGIESATVTGGQQTVTTDEAGSFEVRADTGALLTFTARGYGTGEAVAAETLTVRLDPVVLSGSVSSTMTDEGLSAIVTRDGTEVGASTRQGALTAYGVTAGDRVVVSAEGYEALEVLVREGDLDVGLQPTFATARAQIQEWVDAGKYGKALGWVLRDDLDVPLVRDSMGQGTVDDNVKGMAGAVAAGRSMAALGGDDLVDVYVVRPGRGADAMFGWTESPDPFRIAGQRLITGPYWDDDDVVVTMWWMDPLLVISFTDTADEGEEIITAVMRGQGLDVHSFDRADAKQVNA